MSIIPPRIEFALLALQRENKPYYLPQPGKMPVHKVTVTVPATITHLGPGLNVLGLALSLHATVEMLVRTDDQLLITLQGADFLSDSFDNLVLRVAIRLFQRFERAPAGLQINIINQIPWDVGLGTQTALIVGSIIAANNLVGGGLKRPDIIALAGDFSAPAAGIVAAIYGGLSICSHDKEQKLVHRSLDIVPLRVVIVVPKITSYEGHQIEHPKLVALDDAIFNIGQTALLVEALRTGDFGLLAKSMGDKLHQSHFIPHIPGFHSASQAAYDEGAIAVVLSGKGPALLAIAENYHQAVADAMQSAFADVGIEANTWILSVDRQGMMISEVE
jgi:homoserine kinase